MNADEAAGKRDDPQAPDPGSPVPVIAYATNCYSGESLDELGRAIREEVAAVRRQLGGSGRVGLALRLGVQAARRLAEDPAALEGLRDALEEAGARVVGANAFPISAPVNGVYKDGIYRPDWRDEARLETTLQIARAVAMLADEGSRVVLSTMTGTCRLWPDGDSREAREQCARKLQLCALRLELVSAQTGREILLALEPEPCTTAESLAETLEYFSEMLYARENAEVASRRLGLNLDLSHAAVLFEDPVGNMRAYAEAGIPLFGLHVSAALRADRPAGQVDALRAFDEPKYLHQTVAVDDAGRVAFRSHDLGEFLALPAGRLAGFSEARVHFHVPVFAEEIGGLGTTADVTWEAVRAAGRESLTDLFVVETYTWPQMPGGATGAAGIAEGIARELERTRQELGL